jgi:hypothetical protein
LSRITWGAAGERVYEAGVDRGVLYVGSEPGVPWTGLTSVSENVIGGESRSFYIDGYKYLVVPASEEFSATITAFTYPDLFEQCQGSRQARSGLYLTHQRKKPFGFSYRTRIGNEISGDYGYKIHIVYNAYAAPSERTNSSFSDSIEAIDFSWNITTRAPSMPGYKPTAHVVIDSRKTDPEVLAAVEDILYGNDTDTAHLPDLEELTAAFDTASALVITDNGDGTWTAEAPFDVIRMLDDTTFEITSPTAEFIDEDTYTISSA